MKKSTTHIFHLLSALLIVAAGLATTGCGSTEYAENAPAKNSAAAVATDARELIELRTFVCANAEKRDALLKIFDEALIPALNRQGFKNVGVFWTSREVNDNNPAYDSSVFVLISHTDPAALLDIERRLLADKVYVAAAAELFNAPMKSPLYDSSSSVLLRGFATCPKVTKVTDAEARLFQLRIYNSYTTERNFAKISMFEEGGEIALFRECGMNPVFFAQSVAGDRQPNLTYFLAFPDKVAKDAGWAKFVKHPEWKKLQKDPKYKDTANKITNLVLRPSKGSQL